MSESASIAFEDRAAAAHRLLPRLSAYVGTQDLVVVSLPLGGMIVADEIAMRLVAPLEVTVLSKLVITASGDPVFQYCMYSLIARERRAIMRREVFLRGSRPSQTLAGRMVLFVDDGSATNKELSLALESIKMQRPRAVAVALPITCQVTVRELAAQADEVIYLVCADSPVDAAGYYGSFPTIDDEEVRAILSKAKARSRDGKHFIQSACG